MSGDYRLDDQIQRYQDDRKSAIAEIAARFIARQEMGREAAVDRACQIYDLQGRSLHDPTGVTATLDEAQIPANVRDEAERKQFYAIAQRLLADDLIPDEEHEA